MAFANFDNETFLEAASVKLDEKLWERERIEGFTIDMPHSKDLDDGISLKRLGQNFIVQVSIADVAELIPIGSLVYHEAKRRVHTLYLAAFNIPMIPTSLSEHKLSLLENQLRPSITFEVEINPGGQIVSVNIKHTCFKNIRRYSFFEIDQIVSQKVEDEHYDNIATLFGIANTLHALRRQKGALAIYDIKKKIFTNEEGQVQKLPEEKANRGYILIQELMILANKAVAIYLSEQDVPILYRNHTIRQNAPGRDEILAQVNSLLAGFGQVNMHNSRTALWFNRADYGPELKGHFGLNELAYTHLTSPIRRFPDMVNHYQIKAHITSSYLPFTKQQLYELALGINVKIEEEREERSQNEIKRAERRAGELLGKGEVNAMTGITPREFNRVILQACQFEEVPDSFVEAVHERIGQKGIDPANILYILFVPKRNPVQWDGLRQTILEFALSNEGHATMVLNIATQKKFPLSSFKTETANAASGFMARVVGEVEDQLLTTPMYSQASNKREAMNMAGAEFLKCWANATLVAASQVEKLRQAPVVKSRIETYRQGNWVGKLNSLSMVNPRVSKPEYSFEEEGGSNNPLFTCRCYITIYGKEEVFDAVQKNKSRAKTMAALAAWEELQTNYPDINKKKKEKPAKEKTDLALLYEICHNNQWYKPVFSFSEEEVEGKPHFLGTMKIRVNDHDYENQAMAATKKEAKQILAKGCLRYLKENEGSVK